MPPCPECGKGGELGIFDVAEKIADKVMSCALAGNRAGVVATIAQAVSLDRGRADESRTEIRPRQ